MREKAFDKSEKARQIQDKASRDVQPRQARGANIYTFWYFAEVSVARRLRDAFFGGAPSAPANLYSAPRDVSITCCVHKSGDAPRHLLRERNKCRSEITYSDHPCVPGCDGNQAARAGRRAHNRVERLLWHDRRDSHKRGKAPGGRRDGRCRSRGRWNPCNDIRQRRCVLLCRPSCGLLVGDGNGRRLPGGARDRRQGHYRQGNPVRHCDESTGSTCFRAPGGCFSASGTKLSRRPAGSCISACGRTSGSHVSRGPAGTGTRSRGGRQDPMGGRGLRRLDERHVARKAAGVRHQVLHARDPSGYQLSSESESSSRPYHRRLNRGIPFRGIPDRASELWRRFSLEQRQSALFVHVRHVRNHNSAQRCQFLGGTVGPQMPTDTSRKPMRAITSM